MFPNHSPNPENKEAMKAGVEAVRRSSADLGIVVDTVRLGNALSSCARQGVMTLQSGKELGKLPRLFFLVFLF